MTLQTGSNETFFVVTVKYLQKCDEKGLDKHCSFCRQPFLIGHICHSKFNGLKYKKRHSFCAVKVGLVNKKDFAVMVAGYESMNKLDMVPPPQLVKVSG